jgi:hypothetical protein
MEIPTSFCTGRKTAGPCENSDMLPEYDFSRSIRVKHYKAYREGHTVNIHR